MGQRIMPEQYHQIVDQMKEGELGRFLSQLRASVDRDLMHMPTHQQFINQYCKAH